MKTYTFDVKLWASVDIEAANLNSARQALGNILDNTKPDPLFLAGYNETSVAKVMRVGIEPEEGDEPYRIEPTEVTP